jgi:outer membrane protein assembly factor BamD (BamD/ComL family)
LRRVIRAAFAAALALAVLASCASAPPVDLAGLTPAEVFQQAQVASDSGDYNRALAWYQAFLAKYPDDPERSPWAQYEIAFLHHKMGDDAGAVKLFDELIASYQAGGEGLPPAPLVLAQKVKTLIQEQRSPAP